MPSRHTTVTITSAEIKSISLALEQARDVMCDWQRLHKENVGDWRDTFKLPAEERYAAMVKQWDGWDAPEGQIRALVGVLDALDAVNVMEKQLWKQHGRKQPGEKSMAVEKRESFMQRVKDALVPKEIVHQPTVAELREHGKHEPAWVQEASAFKRSGDLGEFSGERRAQMERSVAENFGVSREQLDQPISSLRQYEALTPTERDDLSKHYGSASVRELSAMTPRALDALSREHAKPESVRELDRGDDYDMGM